MLFRSRTEGFVPDQDDDRRCLGHGSNHAAGTDDTQENEEGLLAARAGALPWDCRCKLTVAGYTRAAGPILNTATKLDHTGVCISEEQ